MKTISQRRSSSLMALRILIRKLQHQLQLSRSIKIVRGGENEMVPEDVKEGYFSVLAANNEEKPMRFVVELSVLKHPSFLRLLKMAEDEYGFQQKGILIIPCRGDELQRVLLEKIGMGVF